jgi:hypothetical protein
MPFHLRSAYVPPRATADNNKIDSIVRLSTGCRFESDGAHRRAVAQAAGQAHRPSATCWSAIMITPVFDAYRLGSDRGSPNHGSTLLSKRVNAQIRSPVRVRTNRPVPWRMPVEARR